MNVQNQGVYVQNQGVYVQNQGVYIQNQSLKMNQGISQLFQENKNDLRYISDDQHRMRQIRQSVDRKLIVFILYMCGLYIYYRPKILQCTFRTKV